MTDEKATEIKKEETKPSVKGVDEKTYKAAEKLVLAAHGKKDSEDDIKASLFMKLKIAMSKLNPVYNSVLKNAGLIVDAKKVAADIDEKIKASSFSFEETSEEISTYIAQVVEATPGSSESRVRARLRKYFEANEKTLPKKSQTKRGRIGAINKTIIDVFAENKKATKQDLYSALQGKDKTDKNAQDYANSSHTLAFALANGLTALQALTEVAKMDGKLTPVPVEVAVDLTEPVA